MDAYRYDETYLKKVFETPDVETANWFGYYNYDVLSPDGTKMLCNRAAFDGRAITAEDTIELGYYDIATGEWHTIDTTDSFNWQQGAMLQWVPGHENWVAYNFSDKQHFKSALYNIATGERRILDFPIYQITPDGRYSVSLHYERSYWCRAYHYQPIQNPAYDVRVAEDDGIFLLDLWENTVKRIVDIHDVIAADDPGDFADAKHWLEHIMISPSGKRMVFLHRFAYTKGYNTRVVIADIDGGNLQVIPGFKNFSWSHFGWCGDDAFVIYTVKKSNTVAVFAQTMQKKNSLKKTVIQLARKFAKRLLPKKTLGKMKASPSYYQFYENEGGRFVLKENLEQPLFDIDGHPTFTYADAAYMVTDSYPDAEGNQRLIVYNTKSKRAVQVGSFFAFYKGNPASCDLHPKLARGDRYLAVDTACSGLHKMMVFELKWEAIKEVIG